MSKSPYGTQEANNSPESQRRQDILARYRTLSIAVNEVLYVQGLRDKDSGLYHASIKSTENPITPQQLAEDRARRQGAGEAAIFEDTARSNVAEAFRSNVSHPNFETENVKGISTNILDEPDVPANYAEYVDGLYSGAGQ